MKFRTRNSVKINDDREERIMSVIKLSLKLQ